MKTVKLDNIIIPEGRIRKVFLERDLKKLKMSIQSLGLAHPIIIKSLEEPVLIAGERRVRAFNLLSAEKTEVRHDGEPIPVGHIPYTLPSELDSKALRELELQENTRRVELTWQERARAISALHEFKVEQHGEYSSATREGWRQQDTKEEITGTAEGASTFVREAQVLTRFLEDKDVAEAPDAKTAMKIIKKKVETQVADYVDEIGVSRSKLKGLVAFHNMSAEEFMEQCAPGIFDCIIADPPYGIEANKHQNFDSIHSHDYEDTKEVFITFCKLLATKGFDVAKYHAHLYVFLDIHSFQKTERILSAGGWSVWKRPLIWNKGSRLAPDKDYGPSRSYETILFANKGMKPTTALYPDVISVPLERDRIHAAQKPVDLYKNLLRRSCMAGDMVLDPCAGSGTAILACRDLHLEVVAVEKDTKYYNAAQARLSPKKEVADLAALLSEQL